jgi:sulfopyruvate decarboxylase TPP-binding subunit
MANGSARRAQLTEVIYVELLSGGEMVVQALEDEGVEYVFGYPGGAVLHIYDALFKHGGKLTHVLVRHEQAATHAADGYARSTGKPGVVLVTSGPGATNAITGIATAYMDSIPMVVIVRAGAARQDRRGRLPGNRHGRHLAADREAQLHGQRTPSRFPRRSRRPSTSPPPVVRARWSSTSPRM